MTGRVVGVDVGGSSIKHGIVESADWSLVGELEAVPTPRPSVPEAMVNAIAGIVAPTAAGLPVGVTLPSVIRAGVIHTAANIDASLVGFDIEAALQKATGRRVACLNDADAAGLAEVRLGAGKGQGGVVMVLTFGTGIGSALFTDGRLVRNTELGHLRMRGDDAEHWASARVRTEQKLDWPAWAERVNEYLDRLHALFWPELFVLGGGVSENFAQFGPLLRAACPVRPASMGPAAGVVGACLAAAETLR